MLGVNTTYSMKGTKTLGIIVVLILLIPVGTFAWPDSKEDIKNFISLDEIDQSQEKSNSEAKIYGGKIFAQSFTPTIKNLTKIEILIGCDYEVHWLVELITSLARSFPFLLNLALILREQLLNLPGNLTIALYDSQDGVPGTMICCTTVHIYDLQQDNGWLLFEFPDVTVNIGETYFIYCTAPMGDEFNCYQWYYGAGNLYIGGKAWSSNDDGSTWNELSDVDFCFRTYGEYTGEEPDGIADRWALVLYDPADNGLVAKNDATKYKNTLEKHPEWNPDHIWIYNRDTEWNLYQNKFQELDQYENEDDVILFIYIGHPTSLGWADNYFDTYGSSIAIIIDCCYAWREGYKLIGERREIITSTDEDKEGLFSMEGFLFTKILIQGLDNASTDSNNDEWISAREAYNYVAPQVPSFNPRFYDGIRDYDIFLVSV